MWGQFGSRPYRQALITALDDLSACTHTESRGDPNSVKEFTVLNSVTWAARAALTEAAFLTPIKKTGLDARDHLPQREDLNHTGALDRQRAQLTCSSAHVETSVFQRPTGLDQPGV